MSRYNHLMAASLVFVCAILCLDSRARGACDPAVAICITQNPSESENVPQSWEIREVEPFGDPYVYEVDLHFIGEGEVGIEFGFSGFNIDRNTGYSTASITISKLTILRPIDDERSIHATIGNSEVRVDAVNEIAVTPRGEGREGYVEVLAYLAGPSSTSVLGYVHGANFLSATIESGDVGGPIECEMHPLSDSNVNEPNKFGTIFLYGSGAGVDLLGDVTMESWSGTTPKLGTISLLSFPNGVIGAINDKVQIKADGVIHDVIGKEIHALISGTDDNPNDPLFDSYTDIIGVINAKVVSGSGGIFTGEIRAEEVGETYGMIGVTLGNSQNIKIEGEMQGRIFLQRMAEGDYGISITNSTPKLRGTILLGCLNPAEGASAWGSDIDIDVGAGQIVLDDGDAAGYSPARPASDLGGGAVTAMPIRLHPDDCFPKQGEKIDPATLANFILMRHYGPVT